MKLWRTISFSALAVALVVIWITSGVVSKAVAAAGTESAKNPVVILDSGHGGVDGGAVAVDGTLEKDLNLQIAGKVRDYLMAMGFQVIMTRDKDESIHDSFAKTIRQKKVSDIRNRLAITQENPKALFVSIHQNMYSDSRYRGAQVFYGVGHPQSKVLAGFVQESLKVQLQPENTRQIKASPKSIYLLYHMESVGVLVECGFLSNWEETRLLKTQEYQSKLAFSIVCGMLDYSRSTGV